jgi:hypothetical protein
MYGEDEQKEDRAEVAEEEGVKEEYMKMTNVGLVMKDCEKTKRKNGEAFTDKKRRNEKNRSMRSGEYREKQTEKKRRSRKIDITERREGACLKQTQKKKRHKGRKEETMKAQERRKSKEQRKCLCCSWWMCSSSLPVPEKADEKPKKGMHAEDEESLQWSFPHTVASSDRPVQYKKQNGRTIKHAIQPTSPKLEEPTEEEMRNNTEERNHK